MEKLLNLYNTARTLDNKKLREFIMSGEYQAQTAGLSKNILQTNLIILDKNTH